MFYRCQNIKNLTLKRLKDFSAGWVIVKMSLQWTG